MNQNDSKGFIETIGLVAAIQAADVMLKSANVRVEAVANADGGLITVICTGDLASCNAAVDAAKATISTTDTYFNSNQIPRPDSDVQWLISDRIGSMVKLGETGRSQTPAKESKKTRK
ncbi:MAG: ethanolamine utilization protein [Deltaproteobacteria bacterium]|nr:MAG: ethanolamine utilization protein [Deltaproteobacteria bacterium]